MFEKNIDKCIDACYQELMTSKNKKIMKVLQTLKNESPNEVLEEMMKSIIRDLLGVMLVTAMDEEEYEETALDMLEEVVKKVPDMRKMCKLKITLDGYEDKIYRIVHVPYSMHLADIGYIILSIFDTMAYHLFDFTIKKQKYLCEVNRNIGEYYESDEFALDYTLTDFNLKKNSKFSFCYDYGENFEFTIQVLEIVKKDRFINFDDTEVVDGKGNGIWEDSHYLMDLYYFNKKEFKQYLEENGLDEDDFPIEDEFDIDTCNGVLYDEFFDIKMGYECPQDDDFS